jgi:hypothetical protein|tara:strand:+ start:347 stop:565 length:219 start_codon:yes stop_codon:yes gene_type:complete
MKLEVITSRLSTNIDNLNKNKKYTFIPQDIMDEFVDILIDLREIDKKFSLMERLEVKNNGRGYKDYSVSKEV